MAHRSGTSPIYFTKWTPELIPDPLPPNIEPALHEPVYRKSGEVIRTTAERRHEAVCLEPQCPLMWSGNQAFPAASAHTSQTGHLTRLYYAVEYVLQINPLHPKHEGRFSSTRMPVTTQATQEQAPPDLPPHKRHRLAQTNKGRQPRPSGSTDRAMKNAGRIAAREQARAVIDARRRKQQEQEQEQQAQSQAQSADSG